MGMTKKDKAFFVSIGVIKEEQAESYSLVYVVGNQSETIMSRRAYALCMHEKKRLKNDPRFKTGTLEIKPNYK